jgi:hypothetical protein
MRIAIRTTVPAASGSLELIVLITSPASTGVATAITEEQMTRNRKSAMGQRNG